MIKEVTYYDVVCDRCGKSLIEENDICCQEPFDAVFFATMQCNYVNIKGKHYCPDCYSLDEKTDEYVPKK